METVETNSTLYARWSWLLAPLLAAIYPVLYTYANSVEEARLADAAICATISLLSALALAFLLRLIYPNAKVAGLAAVVIVAWFFTYSGYMRLGRRVVEAVSSSPLKDYLLLGLWCLLVLVVLAVFWKIRWSEYRTGQVYRFVKLACLFAVALAVVQIIWEELHTRTRPPVTSIWSAEADADPNIIPASWNPTLPAHARDVYYLVFDRYGNEEALNRYFGFDNSEFYAELEKRGFTVDRKATTSYPMTMPSMAATLNMRYLNDQFRSIMDYSVPVQENDVGKLFIAAGYKFHYFGNPYDPLRKSSIAQWNMKISALPSEFAEQLVSMTPLRLLLGRHYKRTLALNRFAGVAKLAENPDPTFAYAHFLLPHPPYSFARDGSPQTETNRVTMTEQQLYVEQVVATNRMILEMIDKILKSSSEKPIIILQADEGPYLMAGDESLSESDQIKKRMGILSAVLIPDDTIRERLPTPMKPVNTFRFLFKEYFGAPFGLLPDRSFYWEKPTPAGVATPGSKIVELPEPPQT